MTEAKTGLTKQEMMRIFEEQIELKNAEIERLKEKDVEYAKLVFAQAKEYAEKMAEKDERLDAIRKHYEKRPPYDFIMGTFEEEKVGLLNKKDWFEKLGVLLKEAKNK